MELEMKLNFKQHAVGSADGYAPITPALFRRCRNSFFSLQPHPLGPNRTIHRRCSASSAAETSNPPILLLRSGPNQQSTGCASSDDSRNQHSAGRLPRR